MNLIYTANVCSPEVYEYLFKKYGDRVTFQAQKYHLLMLQGLSSHVSVDAVSVLNDEGALQAAESGDPGSSLRFHYVIPRGGRLLRQLSQFRQTYRCISRLITKDTVLVTDCLTIKSSLAALLAARLHHCRCIGIVTDMPDMLACGKMLALAGRFVISRCSGYVFLTEAMSGRVNPKKKPYIVLEGQADAAMEARRPDLSMKLKPRVCLYAGSIHKIYGVPRLVEGFLKAAVPDTELHIYGSGDFVDELKAIAEREPSVKYGGMLLSTEVVEREMTAALLVNPRPTDEEYVKYSFPSKTMEYMASGTPVLTTRLPGMPPEYGPHVFFIDEETADGISEALKAALALSDRQLHEKGCGARRFILEERNNIVQAQKLIGMLNNAAMWKK